MAGQYALPKRTPLSAGSPVVLPSVFLAHQLLDTPAGELVAKFAPQYSSRIPPEKAKQTFREVMKTSDFITKSFIMSIVGQHLPKGVTANDISNAVNEKPPAAPAPAAPAAAAPAAAPAAPVVAPPAAAAPAPAASAAAAAAPAIADVIAPPAPVTRGPTTTAAAAMPTGADAALDYIAKHGGHASVLRNGKIVDVHPGEKGSYKALSPELAARLHAAGVAYERATGDKPKFGELSRGEDVQGVYYGRYKSGQGGIAAAPGRSRHQHGEAGDLPDSGFRKWLYSSGNAQRFGLHFPVKGDAPHVQADPAFKGRLATGTGAAAGTVDPSVAAGAGPAAVAAAQSADAKAAAAGPSGKDPNAMRKAFLATIAHGEAPKGAYDYIIGGGRAKDLSQHPRTRGSAGKYGSSDAAGQYQFLSSTWDEQAKKYGYKDFSADTQDTAAWNYAKDVYKQKSGRDLETDLASGDPKTLNNISSTLGQTWTSLPGGTQPNSNWKGKDFASVYAENLKGSGTTTEYPDPTPNVGAGESAYPAAPLDPTPNVGAGAGDYTPTTSPGVDTSTAAAKTDYGKGAGDIFSAMGDLFSKGPVAQNAARPSGPANLPIPILPVPPSVTPTVDPRVAQAQRQQLAMALQRLNSGKLV